MAPWVVLSFLYSSNFLSCGTIFVFILRGKPNKKRAWIHQAWVKQTDFQVKEGKLGIGGKQQLQKPLSREGC